MTQKEIFEAIENLHPCWPTEEAYRKYLELKIECIAKPIKPQSCRFVDFRDGCD